MTLPTSPPLRCAVALLLSTAACASPPPAARNNTIPVSVTTARSANVPLTLQSTGAVEPIRSVTVQSQIGGLLTRVAFREGQDVVEGQILFEIDPRPFQAALDQASATLSRDLAQWQIAQRDVERFEALAAREYVTQQQLDQARTAAASLAATLRADSASITRARLDLQYATIRAPISGRTGQILVREGNLVRAGGEPLLVINQISPVLVRFAVPAQFLDAVRRRAEASLPVHANPADVADASLAQIGTLVFLDNAVDSMTGTLVLKATFPNTNRALWPGALVRIVLELDTERGVTTIPRVAVQTGQHNDVVWIIDSTETARASTVTIRRYADSLAIVESGVSPGDRIVTDGQLRLTEGARVAIRAAPTDVVAVPPLEPSP